MMLPLFSVRPTYATPNSPNCNGDYSFFGLKAWYSGLQYNNNGTCQLLNVTDNKTIAYNQISITNFIWTAVANVSSDIAVIAAYCALGFVIFGGYRYLCSQGDTGKVAAGKKTLSSAFIGLAITMSANVIFNTIRIVLKGSTTSSVSVDGGVTLVQTDTGLLVTSIIQWIMGVAGVVCAVFVVYGGISYTTSAGDPGKLARAKNAITYAIIGLIIVALAETITAFVANSLKTATGQSAYIDNPSDNISLVKEAHES